MDTVDTKMDSGQIGVTGVHAQAHVQKPSKVDGETVKLDGKSVMDPIRKPSLVQCPAVILLILLILLYY